MADWVLADQHPPSYGNFTDCCSDSSYFIPTLTAPHLADQVLADLLPLINGNFTDSCSTLKAHIWQTKCWQINPPSYGNFTDCCSQTTHISVLLWKLHIWQTRSWQIYPPHQWQFYRFLLYSESSYLADQVLADLPPTSMAISQIPALPWEIIFGRPSFGRSTLSSNGNFTDSCEILISFLTLRAQHLADQVLADLPPIKYWFHRWLFIGSHAAPADHLTLHLQISPLNGNFTDSYSESSSFGRPGPDRSAPHPMVILQIPALTAHYSESLSFGRPGLGRSNLPPHQMAISQIPVKFIFHSYS